MLKVVATYPNPGSFARIPGHAKPVRITQNMPDGMVLVTGEGVSGRRIEKSALRPARAPKPRG